LVISNLGYDIYQTLTCGGGVNIEEHTSTPKELDKTLFVLPVYW